jgi:hypothetical protein
MVRRRRKRRKKEGEEETANLSKPSERIDEEITSITDTKAGFDKV